MAYSTSSTFAGAMETLQAQASARFVVGSRLWNLIYPVASTNANTVQLPVLPAPSPVTTATAETASITDAAITISAVSVSPAQIAAATKISTKALLGGQGVETMAFDVLINNVVSGADYDIAYEFNGFTDAGNVSSVASLAVFRASIADLDDVGYGGTRVAALSVDQVDLILAGLSSYTVPQTAEYIGTGYVGRVLGTELVALPSGFMETDTTKVGAIWYKEFGIAFGYHAGDSIGGVMMGTGAPAPLVHMKAVPIDVVSTNLSAAVFGLAGEISTTGGVAVKYALA